MAHGCRVEQKLSLISSMILRTLSTVTILQANNHSRLSRVHLLIIHCIIKLSYSRRNLLWVPVQQEMCDKTQRCMLGLLCHSTKFTSPKRLTEYHDGCTCSFSSSCVSWYLSSALRMQRLATGLLMLLSPRKIKKSAAISSNKYW